MRLDQLSAWMRHIGELLRELGGSEEVDPRAAITSKNDERQQPLTLPYVFNGFGGFGVYAGVLQFTSPIIFGLRLRSTRAILGFNAARQCIAQCG